MYKTADGPEAEAEAVVWPTVISWVSGTVLPLTMKAVPEWGDGRIEGGSIDVVKAATRTAEYPHCLAGWCPIRTVASRFQ